MLIATGQTTSATFPIENTNNNHNRKSSAASNIRQQRNSLKSSQEDLNTSSTTPYRYRAKTTTTAAAATTTTTTNDTYANPNAYHDKITDQKFFNRNFKLKQTESTNYHTHTGGVTSSANSNNSMNTVDLIERNYTSLGE